MITDITLIVDRSGSMYQGLDDSQGGINSFILERAKSEDETVLSLVQFDTDVEVIVAGQPIKEVLPYKLIPRGNTALYDAIGKTITTLAERISKLAESEKPGLVVVVIVTDGQENASREFNSHTVKALITKYETKHNWQFVFLGANQNAFAAAGQMGISSAKTGNYSKEYSSQTYGSLHKTVTRMSSNVTRGLDNTNEGFTDQERESMIGNDKDKV